jgi:hypothetical protein
VLLGRTNPDQIECAVKDDEMFILYFEETPVTSA